MKSITTIAAVVAAALMATAPSTAMARGWTGVYGGVLLGWNTTQFDSHTKPKTLEGPPAPSVIDLPEPRPVNFCKDDDSFNVGIQLGVDCEVCKCWVIGAAIDWSWMNLKAHQHRSLRIPNTEFGIKSEFEIDWLGTARLRAGYILNPCILLYVHGGLAWANIEGKSHTLDINGDQQPNNPPDFIFNKRFSHTHVGWTAGAGIDYMLTRCISLKAEYLYVDLRKEHYFVNRNTLLNLERHGDLDAHLHIVRTGVAYHF